MQAEHELNRDVDVDIGGLFGALWRRKGTLLVAAIVATAIAFAALQFVKPKYRATAEIAIKERDAILTTDRGSDAARAARDLDQEGIETQVQILKSGNIARKVVRQLNLAELDEFDTQRNRSLLDRLLATAGLAEEGAASTREERVLEKYFEKLRVFRENSSGRVIKIQFSSNSEQIAAKVPNAIVEQYLELQQELKRGVSSEQLAILKKELDALSDKAVDAETDVETFRAESGLLDGRNNSTLATQELSELSTELARVRTRRANAEAQAAAVRNALEGGSLDTSSSVLNSPLIQRLRETQVRLQSQIADLSTTLLPGHPRIKALQSQLSDLSSQIRSEARKVLVSLQRDADTTREQERTILQNREALKKEADRVGAEQVKLRALEREAAARREQYNQYLAGYNEALSRQSRQFVPADAWSPTQAGVPPRPYFPKKAPILAGVFFGTLLLGALFVMAANLLSGSAARQRYVSEPLPFENKALEPVEPVVRAEDEAVSTLVAESDPEQSVSRRVEANAPPLAPRMKNVVGGPEETEEIRPRSSRSREKEEPVSLGNSAENTAQTIAMLGHARIAQISPEGERGSEGTVIFARVLAAMGLSTIVVDMTGRGASSRLMLGNTIMTGVKDILTGGASLSESIHGDNSSHAHIMPTGRSSARSAASAGAKLPAILDALEQTYDYLIIDCGSVDADGLAHIANPSTLILINSLGIDTDAIEPAFDAMIRAGLSQPLIVHPAQAERKMMGMAGA